MATAGEEFLGQLLYHCHYLLSPFEPLLPPFEALLPPFEALLPLFVALLPLIETLPMPLQIWLSGVMFLVFLTGAEHAQVIAP